MVCRRVPPRGCRRSSGGWLTIELYSTRALPVKDAVPGSELDVVRTCSLRRQAAGCD